MFSEIASFLFTVKVLDWIFRVTNASFLLISVLSCQLNNQFSGVATYYLKSEKLPTPEDMIQPPYDSEYKFLTTPQQQQPMYEIRLKVANQASWCTISVQPRRYKWRLFRNHQNKLKKSIACLHQNKLKKLLKSTACRHQNKLDQQNDYGKAVRMKHCTSASGSLDDKELYEYVANYAHLLNSFLEVYKLAADQCEDDSGKAAFLGWSKNVKQELERHNSIVEQKRGLDPTRETTLHTATAKYKEFLLATASGDIQGGLDMLKIDGNAFGYADGVFTGEVTRQEHQSVTATPECFEDMVQENEKFILTLSELQLATNSFYKANLLGEGSAGSFCKAQFTDGQIFAARVVDTVALSLHEEHFFNIIQNVACLRHPNIITFTGYCLENGQLVRLNIALGISLALE